jgi:hypothetical protein
VRMMVEGGWCTLNTLCGHDVTVEAPPRSRRPDDNPGSSRDRENPLRSSISSDLRAGNSSWIKAYLM